MSRRRTQRIAPLSGGRRRRRPIQLVATVVLLLGMYEHEAVSPAIGHADAPLLDLASVGGFSRWYVGDLDLSDMPVTLAPGRAEDLTGLPPAYIAVAGHDPLRDDGVRYAELLAAAGVPVQLDNADTLIHGYLGYAGVVPAATAAAERGLSALRDALHRP